MTRFSYTIVALTLVLLSPACATNAESREELAEIGLRSIQNDNASTYRDFLVTLPKLRKHCSETELHRAMLAIPQANENLERAVKSCHELADWNRAILLSIQGGDVYEHALECGGHFARVSSIVATYVVGFERFEIHHRRGYLKDGTSFLVSREPWCTRQ